MLNKLNTELENTVQAFLLKPKNLKLRDKIYELCQVSLFHLAKKFKLSPMLEINDLIQEGYLCLDNCLKKYSIKHSTNFITFFSNQAKRKMQDLIRKVVGIKKHEKEYNDLAIQYVDLEDENIVTTNFNEENFLNPNKIFMNEIKAKKIAIKIKSAKLTKNELQVLSLTTNLDINQGTHDISLPELTNTEIGNRLNLTNKQVENFKNKAFTKLEKYFKIQLITENDENYIRFYEVKKCYNSKTKLYNQQHKTLIAIIIKTNGLCFLTKQFYNNHQT
ncbi:sigma-70 family RNA polymerase sigma factor [Candidatus Phytoplasma pyri]|uniref:sigma-70 family RNA polymerase sigma factor n=1 Tax=Candidatus Phytoplasma pyri TaxID=47566 RepID=UPI003982FB5C